MFGRRLARLRLARGWNQTELARRVGVSASAIGMYEQGRREPDCATLTALAHVLCTSTDYLLTGRTQLPDAAALFSDFEHLMDEVRDWRLRAPDGSERPFGREELAMLLCALDAAQRGAQGDWEEEEDAQKQGR